MILTEEDLIGGVQEVIGRFWTVAAVEDESEMVTISGHQDARRNDEKNLLKALAHQSLSVAIDASARDFQRLWGRFGPWCYCSWVWIKQGFRLYHCEKFLGTNMEGGEKGYIRMNTGKPGVSVESIRCFLPHQTEVVISFYPICI
ncbi:unnamed protein product [Brassica rapa]|uniref:Uncharacterized protein n=2 Tax=Brassica TaxID=3705 RepID=A0A8D9LR38_BRACM|nr:unnamed protein product [Brassica napus]CAG7883703.1 unnamed protein product [Brassica rapa]